MVPRLAPGLQHGAQVVPQVQVQVLVQAGEAFEQLLRVDLAAVEVQLDPDQFQHNLRILADLEVAIEMGLDDDFLSCFPQGSELVDDQLAQQILGQVGIPAGESMEVGPFAPGPGAGPGRLELGEDFEEAMVEPVASWRCHGCVSW
jgi:hypothetical protein